MAQKLGFIGELSDVRYVESAPLPCSSRISLPLMAKKSLKYLYTNPLPDKGFQCRFTFAPSCLPPIFPNKDMPPIGDLLDPIAEGDTENRNDMAFSMMREMTGETEEGASIEEAVHQRLIGWVKRENGFGHGMCWNHGYSSCVRTGHLYVNPWTTGMLLHSECMRHRRRLNDLSLATNIVKGLMDLAVRENGHAYFPNGMAAYNEEENTWAYSDHYVPVMNALCEYWLLTDDEECLNFLYELAEGMVCDTNPRHLHRADGGLDGHNHVHLHSIRGMAQFAYLTKNPRYIQWVKGIYDYYRRWALDTGWLPEIRDLADHSNHSETCLNADMTEIEIWLALSGYDELWDQVERDLRNYFAPLQFEITPAFEAWYRRIHKDASKDELANALKMMQELEGGFVSAVTPNDFVFEIREGGAHFGTVNDGDKRVSFDMMGCCPPSGMRAIYWIWKYAQYTETGVTTVTLPIDSESEHARVETSLPEKGELRVTAKTGGTLHVRVPAWAPRDAVTVLRGDERIPTTWGGTSMQYVAVKNVAPGETITVRYPLIDLWQSVSITPHEQPTQHYRYHWIGNTVKSVSPAGQYLPLYPTE